MARESKARKILSQDSDPCITPNSIFELFSCQAETNSEAVAAHLSTETSIQQLSYGELLRQINTTSQQIINLFNSIAGSKIAHCKDPKIAVCLNKDEKWIITIFALLKAKIAFIPIDPELPNKKITRILENSKPALVLSSENLRHKIDIPIETHSYTQLRSLSVEPQKLKQKIIEPLAYIIYSSGTTAAPKGIRIKQADLQRRLLHFANITQIKPTDNIAWLTNPSFDMSLLEYMAPLCFGASTTVISPSLCLDIPQLAAVLSETNCTMLQATPSFFKIAVKYIEASQDNFLANKRVLSTGEALTIDLAYKLVEFSERCWNFYGPTESVIWCTVKELNRIKAKRIVPVGLPLEDTRVAILSEDGHLIFSENAYERGEILLHTPSISETMYNGQDRSSKHLVRHSGKLFFKTGDIGYFNKHGDLKYLCRKDDKCKIHGRLIEPFEIESVLAKMPGIASCAIQCVNDEIHAYIVLDRLSEIKLTSRRINIFLRENIEKYKLPSVYWLIEDIPLTHNQKIDYERLKNLGAGKLNHGDVDNPPQTALEKTICKLWQETLNIETQIDINDDFFSIGGNSINAYSMLSQLCKQVEIHISFSEFYSGTNTIHKLVEFIQNHKESQKMLSFRGGTNKHPVSLAQQRILFIYYNQKNSKKRSVFNISYTYDIPCRIDETAFSRAFNELVNRHEILRTTFSNIDGNYYQHIQHPREVKYNKSLQWESSKVKEFIDEPFNLETGPMFRLALLNESNQSKIIFVIHHICMDGPSENIIHSELSKLYAYFSQSTKSGLLKKLLPPIKFQNADFAIWQNQYFNECELDARIAINKSLLCDLPDLSLPYDGYNLTHDPDEDNSVCLNININEIKNLTELLTGNATFFIKLLTAFKILIAQYCSIDDVFLSTAHSERNHVAAEDLIGFFVNILEIRTKLEGNPTYKQLVEQVKHNFIKILSNEVPYQTLINFLNQETNGSHFTKSKVAFVYDEGTNYQLEIHGHKVTPSKKFKLHSVRDLLLLIQNTGEQLNLQIIYNKKHFKPTTIQRLLDNYVILLKKISKNPNSKIFSYKMLSGRDKLALKELNNTTRDYEQKLIYRMFENDIAEVIGRHGSAIEYGDIVINYKKLNIKANKLANYLATALAEKEYGNYIGVCHTKNQNFPISILAILKAGYAYLPIDPKNPNERLEYFIRESQIKVLITEAKFKDEFDSITFSDLKVIYVDQTSFVDGYSDDNLTIEKNISDLAYGIFTSGTSGNPKLTRMNHSGVINLVNSVCSENKLAISQNSRILQFLPFGFDGAAVWDLWTSLLTGACLVIDPRKHSSPGQSLTEVIENESITHLTIIPSAARCTPLPRSEKSKLEKIIFVGESVSYDEVSRWRSICDVCIAYGTTENSVDTTLHIYKRKTAPIKKDKLVTIGRPIDNNMIKILNSYGYPVPIGCNGFLYVTSPGLTDGYHNRQVEFEKACFRDQQNILFYNTKDIVKVRYDKHGRLKLFFMGRENGYLNFHGYRIEASEIEKHILNYTNINQAKLLYNKKHDCLVAYITLSLNYQNETELEVLKDDMVEGWREVNKLLYKDVSSSRINHGWRDKFFQKAIPEDEILELVRYDAELMHNLNCKKVLILGCGNGIRLEQLLEFNRHDLKIENIFATDPSIEALNAARKRIRSLDPDIYSPKIDWRSRAALSDTGISGDNSRTLIVLNSVLQYFPDINYLESVLRQSIQKIDPQVGGQIFIGDIRNFDLLYEYYYEYHLLQNSEENLYNQQLSHMTHHSITQEQELVISPNYFIEKINEFKQEFDDRNIVLDLRLRPGSGNNELTRYRYDLIIHVCQEEKQYNINWQETSKDAPISLEEIKQRLSESDGEAFGFKNIPNANIFKLFEINEICRRKQKVPVNSLLKKYESNSTNYIHPGCLDNLAKQYGLRAYVTFSEYYPWFFDVAFHRFNFSAPLVNKQTPFRNECANSKKYTAPLEFKLKKDLEEEVIKYLRGKLPYYMVPGHITILEKFPLTANTKLDIKALPEVINHTKRAFTPPREKTHDDLLAGIWAEILRVKKELIGIDHTFCELGGGSLKLAALIKIIEERFSVSIDYTSFYSMPTIREISEYISKYQNQLACARR